jgi:hypothetical protein
MQDIHFSSAGGYAAVADPESFHWVGIQYRNSAPQYATVLATVLRYLGRRESGVVLGLPKTRLGPPLRTGEKKSPHYLFFFLAKDLRIIIIKKKS